MANVGRVVSEPMPSGRTRWRLDFGWADGKRIRLNSIPSPVDPARRISIADEAMAHQVLASIRAELIAGRSLEAALSRYRAKQVEEDLVETRLAAYLAWWEQRVEQGRRSPTTLREIRRYAAPGGPWSWWFGRSVHDLTNADVRLWHVELGRRSIALKTQKNISDAFRTFLRHLHADDVIERVPVFPTIDPGEPDRSVLDLDTQARVIAAIPWEARGLFLIAANHLLRLSEVRALDLDDYEGGRIHVARAAKGPLVGAPVGPTKNRTDQRLEVWDDELLRWLDWRLEQATPEARLRGEIALCFNPRADRERNPTMRWVPNSIRRTWRAACKKVGVRISFQEGTRHSTATALAERLPERALRAVTRHRDARSLDHYTTNLRPAPAEIRRILRPS